MRIRKKISYFNLYLLKILFLFQIKRCASYIADDSVVDFSVNDIFNSELIPDQLDLFFNYSVKENLSRHMPEWTCFDSPDLNVAVKTMTYHRHMINEYLLSNYLSKEILDYLPNSLNVSEAIQKRSGKANKISFTDGIKDNRDIKSLPSNHKLLEDEGLFEYTAWLKRKNTFEDIQKQLLTKRKQHRILMKKFGGNRRQPLGINVDSSYGEADNVDGLDYLEDADITGYAFTSYPTEQPVPIKTHKISMVEEKSGNVYKQALNKAGYDNGYDDYNALPHPVHNYAPSALSKQSKEIGLKDITDIALTTLAFLSFGMFILQVLMCITMGKDDTSNMVMLPMEGTLNADLSNDGNTEEIRRKRRSILPSLMQNTQNIQMINNLSKRALFSLNAVISMSKDGGSCYQYSLCENNKFARRLDNTKTLWIPAWSLGLSWLTIKFSNSNKISVVNDNPVMNSLKAIIVGLNNGDCSFFYKRKCKVLLNSV